MKIIQCFFLLLLVGISACSTQHKLSLVDGVVTEQPSWMNADVHLKEVTFDLVAGWDGSNNAFNYNGYYAGGVTLNVPSGWKVNISLANQDASAPHHIMVTRPYKKGEIPNQLSPDETVLSRAYMDDIYHGEHESMSFIAKEGHYWLFCGIMGHGVNDMWIEFDVNSELSKPEVVIR